ncbi:hypothetical protein SK128_019344 [Halocaridina rubra]|uniref:Secreted protein n=1 Tax=Halocaridina rubra TaxID=373956 RepID=A0AAN8X299_HALRR
MFFLLYFTSSVLIVANAIATKACNQTFYGLVDHMYQIDLQEPPTSGISSEFEGFHPLYVLETPPSEALICILTFSAIGGSHGDIVQITFTEFHVGHFNISADEGVGVGGCSGGLC